jgi:hypothetical protein
MLKALKDRDLAFKSTRASIALQTIINVWQSTHACVPAKSEEVAIPMFACLSLIFFTVWSFMGLISYFFLQVVLIFSRIFADQLL